MMNYTNPNDLWRPGDSDPMKGLSDDERMAVGCINGAAIILAFILCLLFCAMCSGCTTTKYVPVPEYHTDTVRITKHTRDSIYLSDSIYVNDFVRDDTVYKTIERWRTKYIERMTHDTLYQSKRDSIPYPVEVIKEVPAKLTWWQQTRLHLANILLYLILIVGIIYIGRRHLKK